MVNIKELLSGVKVLESSGAMPREATALYYDSRKVTPDSVFFAVPGNVVDGHDYAAQAVEQGATLLIVQRLLPIEGCAQLRVEDVRKAMAHMSANFYGRPADRMKMVGITGTNGKTSTTHMVRSILENAGQKVGIIGTIANYIGDEQLYTRHTTPESLDLHELLHKMYEKHVDTVVMEVSSHALSLHRTYGITYDVGAFTNMTQDHLDFHHTWDAYRDAKKMLFYQSRVAVINRDDEQSAYMAEGLPCPVNMMSVDGSDDVSYQAYILCTNEKGTYVAMNLKKKRVEIPLQFIGRFSVYNALCASAICFELGIAPVDIREGLSKLTGVAGRCELIPTPGMPYDIILDYAHTPDGLQNILNAVREYTRGKLYAVFGCGGDRDRTKRPIMGQIGGELADFCVVTSDNPRTEDPFKIIEAVEAGVEKTGCPYICIENRREAILYAMTHAEAGDMIVLAGKGHETYQEINGVRHDFDEKVVVSELLQEIAARQNRGAAECKD